MRGLLEQLHTGTTLWRNAAQSRARLLEYQSRKLRTLLRIAERYSDYYRTLFSDSGASAGCVSNAEELHKLPFTTKSDLRAMPFETWSTGRKRRGLVSLRTAGSSGHRFTIHRTRWENHLLGFFPMRARHQWGVGRRDVTASVVGVFPDEGPRWEGRVLQALGIGRTHRISCQQAPEKILAELTKIRPDVLSGYPSAVGHLVDWATRHGRTLPRPRIVIIGGETVLPHVRQRIGSVFNAPVLVLYGAHECNLIAWECPVTGYYHVCEDSVVVELLRHGEPVAEGERGEVVLTNLHSYSLPFIRYRLGDIARRGPTPCPCGQPFATLADVEGRWLDYYRLPDGRSIHHYEFIGPLIENFPPWLWHYQMVQESESLVVMRAVAIDETKAEDVELLAQRMRQRWGPGLQFEIDLVDEIPLTAGGKFRLAYSKLGSDYDDFQWPEVGADDRQG